MSQQWIYILLLFLMRRQIIVVDYYYYYYYYGSAFSMPNLRFPYTSGVKWDSQIYGDPFITSFSVVISSSCVHLTPTAGDPYVRTG